MISSRTFESEHTTCELLLRFERMCPIYYMHAFYYHYQLLLSGLNEQLAPGEITRVPGPPPHCSITLAYITCTRIHHRRKRPMGTGVHHVHQAPSQLQPATAGSVTYSNWRLSTRQTVECPQRLFMQLQAENTVGPLLLVTNQEAIAM